MAPQGNRLRQIEALNHEQQSLDTYRTPAQRQAEREKEREGREDKRVDGKKQRDTECEGGVARTGGIIITVIL